MLHIKGGRSEWIYLLFCSSYCALALGWGFGGRGFYAISWKFQPEIDVNLTLNLGPLKPAIQLPLPKFVPSYVFQGFLFLGSDGKRKTPTGMSTVLSE